MSAILKTVPSPGRAFEYVGGDPALDLVNTIDYTAGGPKEERLTGYGQLTRWAEGAGILSSKAARSFRAKAAARPREAEGAYRNGLRARGVLERLFRAIAQGAATDDVLDEFNHFLGQALEHMRVTAAKGSRPRSRSFELSWKELGERLDSIMWPVVWSAASLIVSEEARRIRICGGSDCGWMYVDRSRNKLRRWCRMETCGTREKSRRRYQRLRLEAPS